MSSHVSAAGLIQAMKGLSIQWERTRAHWHDVKSQEFEREYLGELPQQIARAATAIEEINTLLQKVRSDCE